MVKRYAVIEETTGRCVNTILYDPAANPDWTPPTGCYVLESETRQIDPPLPAPVRVPPPIGGPF